MTCDLNLVSLKSFTDEIPPINLVLISKEFCYLLQLTILFCRSPFFFKHKNKMHTVSIIKKRRRPTVTPIINDVELLVPTERKKEEKKHTSMYPHNFTKRC